MLPTSLSPVHSSSLYSPSLFPFSPFPSSSSSFSSSSVSLEPSSHRLCSVRLYSNARLRITYKSNGLKLNCSLKEPLKVMISGAPASGKGTQCELIVRKFGLVHISTGDLLRAEVSSGTEIGNKAKEFMNAGRLVPDEVVTAMVTARLSREDAKENGWLLDGYPRSFNQAQSLQSLKIIPDVPDEILIDRCIGRRLDPVTGKIYHLKSFPPETEEIKARLITRPDDTEEKVKSRLEIYKKNADAISTTYSHIMKKDNWRGIPTKLNNIPHSRDIRKYFYEDVLQATQRAINDGRTRLKDVYRIGTLMELVRYLALSFADDGKHVKDMIMISIPLVSLLASAGGKEVDEQDDLFILVAPQNAVGNCIIDDLRAMTDAAGDRPVILINPRLKTMGRDKRLEYASSFENCYLFRLLYYAGTQYPIMGALRMSYPYRYELYKRVDDPSGKEKYVILSTFPAKPSTDEVNDAFEGKPR
ncbi:hypothetical protein ACE6H2_025610 [Prunus campanulata]